MATQPQSELQSGVGHVFVAAQDGKADGLDLSAAASGPSDKTRSRSWIIRSSTTPTSVERKLKGQARDRFDVLGVAQVRQRGGQCRIEPLHVSHLEHGSAAARGCAPVRRPRSAVAASGFSISTWMPRSRNSMPRSWCRSRGRGDHRGVDVVEQRLGNRPEAGVWQAAATRLRWAATGSTTRDQADGFHRGELLGVESAQASRADHGHAQRLHAALLRSRPRPWRAVLLLAAMKSSRWLHFGPPTGRCRGGSRGPGPGRPWRGTAGDGPRPGRRSRRAGKSLRFRATTLTQRGRAG